MLGTQADAEDTTVAKLQTAAALRGCHNLSRRQTVKSHPQWTREPKLKLEHERTEHNSGRAAHRGTGWREVALELTPEGWVEATEVEDAQCREGRPEEKGGNIQTGQQQVQSWGREKTRDVGKSDKANMTGAQTWRRCEIKRLGKGARFLKVVEKWVERGAIRSRYALKPCARNGPRGKWLKPKGLEQDPAGLLDSRLNCHWTEVETDRWWFFFKVIPAY